MPKRKRSRERRKAARSVPAAKPTLEHTESSRSGSSHPRTGFTRLRTPDEGKSLAAHLLGASRTQAAVAVSIHPDAEDPWIDLNRLSAELNGYTELYLLDAEATFGLTDGLGNRQLSVFYGAGRVYPLGDEWTRDMYQAPLHMCLSAARGERTTRELVDSALNAAQSSGAFAPPPPEPEDRPAIAVVRSLLGHQAMLATDGGETAAMTVSRLRAGIEPDRLVRPGMKLRGRLRGSGALVEFLPDVPKQDVAERIGQTYRDGDVVLAQVCQRSDSSANVLLHPDLAVEVVGTLGTELEAMVAPGDVLPVEITQLDGRWLATLAEGESATTSISILPDGPPWLRAADLAASTSSNSDQPRPDRQPSNPEISHETSVPTDIRQLQRALAQALDTIEQVDQRASRLESELLAAREQARIDRANRRRAERAKLRVPVVHDDPVEQLRLEVRWAYLLRFRGPDRDAYPWTGDYRIGDDFESSISNLQGVSRDKITDVMAEIVCGLVDKQASRELHPWLDRRGGKQESRTDGSMAWRVSLQANTPGARRLKFWRHPDGTIEFDSVGHHDQGIR